MKRFSTRWMMTAAVIVTPMACAEDDADDAATDATDGSDGSDATDGSGGSDGSDGSDATDGEDGTDVADGDDGSDGTGPGTIPEVATAAGNFTSLLAAATKAGLVETLSSAGPFTVFAPTDAAFLKAGIDLDTFDTPDELAQLTAILTYHAAVGKVLAADLSDGQEIETVNGATLAVSIDGGTVMVGDATVTTADVMASNGVIHIIDTVLMPPAEGPGDIVAVASAAGSFTKLLEAATKAGLADDLMTPGPFTMFAPTDAAFEKAGIDLATFDTAEELEALTAILTYHVIAGEVKSTDLSDGQKAKTLNGAEVTITIADGKVMVDGATVTTADVDASNGVIHIIDTVLMPPVAELGNIVEVAQGAGTFTALIAAATKAGLADELTGAGPLTVFAPNDEAFTKAGIDLATFDTPEELGALTNILVYHVVNGKVLSTDLSDGQKAATLAGPSVAIEIDGANVTVNGAKVIAADVMASNGVIHVIDTVLIPPGNIPAVATAAGDFTSLLAAVTRAGLAPTLSGAGPFTVFAPNDAAFTKLGLDLMTYDTPAEISALANILLGHVVPAKAYSSSLADGQQLDTAATTKLTVDIDGATVKVGGSTVIAVDIEASNGVIHVIDTVIMP